eukprot:1516648-Pyramimonas_sp.AAC.1
MAIVRKSDLCQCGCRGMCTLAAAMGIIVWSFNAMSTGLFPDRGHDDRPFADEIRAAKRGFALAGGLCAAVCEMRADLLEIHQA